MNTDHQRRLADRLARLDAERFCGRDEVLERIEELLAGSDTVNVVLLHGPGGTGKSALLREIGRRATARGRSHWLVDARMHEPVPGDLERSIEPAFEERAPVVMIDSFERIAALAVPLRERILPKLPDDALVVIAGRGAPGPEWFREGWEHVVDDVAVGPLPAGEARRLLETYGVIEAGLVEEIVHWAQGSPLALTLAASTAQRTNRADLGDQDLSRMIVQRLAGDELDEVDADVIAVAAVGRAVDARLLAGVLPGRATRVAFDRLRQLSAVETVGARVTLHDLVRAALRAELRATDPERYNELRRRLADHLFQRATSGESRLLLDMLELIDDPDTRWGLGGDGGAELRTDRWRSEAVGPLVDAFIRDEGAARWHDLRTLIDAAPELALTVYDSGGALIGFSVATTPSRHPAEVRDLIIDPVLQDARAAGVLRSMIWRESYARHDYTGPPPFALMNLSSVLRSGLANVDRSYILDHSTTPEPAAFYKAVGAVRRPDLDVDPGPGRRVECWMIDHHPSGMLGQVRDQIHAEAGAPSSAAAADAGRAERRAAALSALVDFNKPTMLAANPLAVGSTVEERAGELQARVRAAVVAAFGDTPTDRLLRQVVELADLDPKVTHDAAIVRLSVSRATFYRRLREARERVATVLEEPAASA